MNVNWKEILKADVLANSGSRRSRNFLRIFRRIQFCENRGGYYRIKAAFLKCIKRILFRDLQLDINEKTEIGKGLRLPHPYGIVISKYACIGEYCTIYHQVTLGANEHKCNYKNGPTLGNRVYVGAGAKLIGDIIIGDNVVIGANAVVTKDVPDNCTVVGYNKFLLLEHERNC